MPAINRTKADTTFNFPLPTRQEFLSFLPSSSSCCLHSFSTVWCDNQLVTNSVFCHKVAFHWKSNAFITHTRHNSLSRVNYALRCCSCCCCSFCCCCGQGLSPGQARDETDNVCNMLAPAAAVEAAAALAI